MSRKIGFRGFPNEDGLKQRVARMANFRKLHEIGPKLGILSSLAGLGRPAGTAHWIRNMTGTSPGNTSPASAQRQHDAALRSEERRSHEILSSMGQGFIFLDSEFRLLQINDEGLRIDGRPAWELWPGTEQLPVGDAYKKAMKERVPVSLLQNYPWNGENRWLDIQCYPADDGIAVFYRDVSASKQAANILSDRQEQLQLAIDAADVGEWDVDMASQTMYWPARVKAMFGISAHCPVTLSDFYDGLHPDDRERTLASFARTADPLLRSQYESEYRTIGKEDQVVRWVAAKGRGLFNEAGECTRIIGTAIDITKRKASDEALRESEERLRHADRRKDEFLAMLAHELRNPLAPIRAAADLLQFVELDEQRVRQTSQIIGRQVKHMTDLVDDLLDVSRVTSGLVELESAPLDINQMIAEAIEQAAPIVRSRRHRLALQLTPDTTLVMGDRKRLVQVLANLLNNAAKYTDEGGQITVQSKAIGTQVMVEIIDNGIGMNAELIARAFDLFAQAERTSDRSSGGLGLGLALVKSLVSLHGGTVSCDSPGPGKGSTFTVCLPRLVEEQANKGMHALHAAPGQAPRTALNIMLVDDNVDAAAMLSMLLESVGHRVTVEHGALAALQRSTAASYDVFLLDIGLPDIDGYELAQRLRAQPATAGAVLIAVTGYGQQQDRAHTSAAGFDHHLVKPVDFHAMSAILAGIAHSPDS